MHNLSILWPPPHSPLDFASRLHEYSLLSRLWFCYRQRFETNKKKDVTRNQFYDDHEVHKGTLNMYFMDVLKMSSTRAAGAVILNEKSLAKMNLSLPFNTTQLS